MSQEFADFAIWQAASLGDPSLSGATYKIENSSQIQLHYCIPKRFDKKITDITGVQSDENVHPDTGPAGAFVELQIQIDRSTSSPEFLKTLLRWFGTQNTDSDFKRGFLGLANDDNPELDLVPAATLGYKVVHFGQIDPIDFKSRQIYQVLLQFGGRALDLPVFP